MNKTAIILLVVIVLLIFTAPVVGLFGASWLMSCGESKKNEILDHGQPAEAKILGIEDKYSGKKVARLRLNFI